VTGLVPLTRFNEQIAAWDGTTTLRFDRARLPDELVPMAVALEESADRIERAFARERRFGANAAHELRTPLAEIRAMAELVSRWPEEAGRAPEIVEIVDRMSARLAQLAELSRAEHASLDSAPIDLRGEVRAAVDALAEQAAERRLQFDVSLSESYITSDGTAVRAIVDNVIGNAVAHAPEGSVVTVRLDGTELEVRNPAPQLQPADIPRLFERFWRPAGAGHDERHSGLGLSLVALYAEATGAEARAALEQGDLVLTVRWS
jgi:signal transduction histidine kinase